MANELVGELRQLILQAVPEDGSAMGNQALRERVPSGAASEGLEFSDAAFDQARDALLDEGSLQRGKGRGGSVRLAQPRGGEFALRPADAPDETQATDKPDTLTRAHPAARRAAGKSTSDPDATVMSYRQTDKRKNNPEVGLVSEKNQPPEPKAQWAYDPHLDPALQFDVGRARIERLIDDALESGEAFSHRVLGKLAAHRDPMVINDEAHHAYRQPADVKVSKREAEALGFDLDEATRWIEGLDRIHGSRRINRCFDLSATPFAPTGRANSEAGLFGWIVSDFGLNDAIEAGLVKTPRVVVRDNALPDAKTLKPKLYHLYRDPSVSGDLNRRGAEPHEALPKLVQDAYTILGADWTATLEQWQGHSSPPLMLTVCNRTETAARIEHFFTQADAYWPELQAPERTLRVDSKVLEKAEMGETATADKAYEDRLRQIVAAVPDLPKDQVDRLDAMKKEELLREIVDTVGKRGRAGQGLQNVISVAMLSEGWDAKNVTHILGLRAFTSQLLCEQVIGRGLRRVSYETDDNGYFVPEYVNVFGVPLSVFQDGSEGGEAPPPPKPSTQIESLASRADFEIKWPNILRVDSLVQPRLVADWDRVPELRLDPALTAIGVEIGPAVGGVANLAQVTRIDLERLPEEFRQQRIVFKAARKAFDSMQGHFNGGREYLVFQLIRLVEQYLASGRIDIPTLFHQEPLRRRILYALNMDEIVQHLVRHVGQQNIQRLEPVFDEEHPIGSTRHMRTWYTTRPVEPTQRSQISHIAVDSAWEKYAANLLETSPLVAAYARNERLGFQIIYLFGGSRRRYLPDFIVRLNNGLNLVLEIKGVDSPQDQAKREAIRQWTAAVNEKGGFGRWAFDVAFEPAKVHDILARHAGSETLREERIQGLVQGLDQ